MKCTGVLYSYETYGKQFGHLSVVLLNFINVLYEKNYEQYINMYD